MLFRSKILLVLLKSKIRFLAITQYEDVLLNTDIVTGKHRKINLSIKPFNLPEAFMKILDSRIDDCRYLNIYKILP